MEVPNSRLFSFELSISIKQLEHNIRKLDLFNSCFLNLFLRTVFENIENIILMFSENSSYSLNFVFFGIKKDWKSNMFSIFSLFSLFCKNRK